MLDIVSFVIMEILRDDQIREFLFIESFPNSNDNDDISNQNRDQWRFVVGIVSCFDMTLP